MAKKLLFTLRNILIALAALCILWVVFATWLVNPLSQRLLAWVGQHELNSRLSVQSVHLAPFSLKLDVIGLKLTRMDGQPLAGIDRLHAEPSLAGMRNLAWQVRLLQIDHPYAFLQRDNQGQLNWSPVIHAINSRPPSPKSTGLPRILLQQLQIRQGDFRYTGSGTNNQPWQASLNPFNLDISNLTTLKEQTGAYSIRAELPHQGGSLSWSGHLALNPLATDGVIALEGIQVNRLTGIMPLPSGMKVSDGVITSRLPYHLDMQQNSLHLTVTAATLDLAQPDLSLPVSALQSPLRLTGQRLQLGYSVLLTKAAALDYSLNLPEIRLTQLQASSGGIRLARLGSLDIRQIRVDPDTRAVHVAALQLDNLQTQLRRDRHGKLNIPLATRKTKQPPDTTPAAGPTPVGQAAASSTPWHTSLDHLVVNGVQMALQDDSTGKPLKLDLTHGKLAIDQLGWPLPASLPVRFAIDNARGGKLQLTGNYQPGNNSGTFSTRIDNWSLMPIAPLVNKFARLTMQKGNLSTDGKLDFHAGKPAMQLQYAGNVSIDQLSIHEQDTGKNFLGWNSLAARGLRYNLQPAQLEINELVATKPYAKIIIYADKSLNLQRIQRKQPATTASGEPSHAAATKTSPQAGGSTSSSASKPAMQIRIRRIHVVDGSADYSDLSLPTPFGTRIHALHGYVVGLSSKSSDSARVELYGKVDQYGTASLTGRLQPFHATDNTHLKLAFTNIEMANLTPYSGKFAGRKIDSGRLSATMDYTIVRHQLNGKNTFIINKLKLGERVDSQDAVNLPLNLAIALLEDDNGVINLDLPVTGDLNDPKFSYGGIIWKAIVNVFTKVVTAPFRALGHLFGLSGDHPEQVAFAPGNGKVAPPEQEKLAQLVQALNKRQTLHLGVQPGWNEALDRPALQKLALRTQVASMLGLKIKPGQNPGPMDPDDGQTRRVLEKLCDQQLKGGYAAFARQTRLYGHALYVAIKHELQNREPVGADQLKALGDARGSAIRAQLVDRFHLPANRLDILPAQAVSAQDDTVIVGLRLSAE